MHEEALSDHIEDGFGDIEHLLLTNFNLLGLLPLTVVFIFVIILVVFFFVILLLLLLLSLHLLLCLMLNLLIVFLVK